MGNKTLASYTYGSHNGVLNSVSYGNGQSISYTRDNLERITGVYYNGSANPSTSYVYYGEGTLGSRTDHDTGHVYGYGYDGLNRLTNITEYYNSNAIFSAANSYDTAGRISQYLYWLSADWSGTQSWVRNFNHAYNADGTLASVQSQFGTVTYSYDGLKRLSSRTRNNGVRTFTRSYTYASGGNGGNTCPLVSQVSNGTYGSFSYSYDGVGNITAVSGAENASFTYDNQNQLLSETRGGITTSYTYDGAGNLLSKSTGETYTYGDSDWKDLLTAYNGHSITYDAIGNPTVWHDGSSMTWTKGRRLASKGNVSFTYDAEGHRLTKTAGGVEHKYLWQGDRLISEQYGSNTLEFLYDEAGKPVGVSVNGAVFEYITNLQGDILKVVYGGTGDVWAEYTYDAWGKVLTATGNLAAANPLRYRGYFYDTETNLYYVHNRYYDPQLCRWINADSLASTGQGFLGCNMFAYCGNNPVVTKDSSGSLSNRVDVWDGGGIGISGTDIESRSILYDVPLYYQDDTNLCWAFCMLMRRNYFDGISLDELQAHEAAIEIGERYHPILGWDTGLPFFMLGKKVKYTSIEDLYLILQENGPVYAAYRHKNIFDGHIVLITGVDLNSGYIYTNNPWFVQGMQTEEDFKRGFVDTSHKLVPDYSLSAIYIPFT